MWEEFKEFALKGNALSLAIGVIIGAAFGKILDALANDIIMPILGIAGKADFTNYYVPLSSAVTATNLTDARKQGGVLAYGDFITVVINFLIFAIALFVAIKAINMMTRRAAKEPPAPAPPTQEVVLLTEIRDQLARRGAEHRYVAAFDAASFSGAETPALRFRAIQKDACATMPAARSTDAEANAGLDPQPARITSAPATAI